jgi:hypothetical protein
VRDARNGRTTPRIDVLAAVNGSPPPATNPPPPPPPPATIADCVVPRVVGKTLAVARSTIASRHCALGRVTKTYSSARKGRVVRQSPLAGARRPAGTRVNVAVSRGKRKR